MIVNMMKNILLTTSLTLLLLSAQAAAEDKNESRFSLGYGVAIKKNNRTGNTYEDSDSSVALKSFPLVQFTYNRLSLGAGGLAYRFYGHQFAGASFTLNFGGERYEAPMMAGRKRSVMLGTQAKFGPFGLQFAGDISGRSEGFEAQISFGKMLLKIDEQIIRGTLFVEWHDNHYTNYYYGVKTNEVINGRPAYSPDNVFTPGIGVLGIFKLSEDLSFTTGITTKYIVDRLQRSPTVENEPFEIGGFAGLSYSL